MSGKRFATNLPSLPEHGELGSSRDKENTEQQLQIARPGRLEIGQTTAADAVSAVLNVTSRRPFNLALGSGSAKSTSLQSPTSGQRRAIMAENCDRKSPMESPTSGGQKRAFQLDLTSTEAKDSSSPSKHMKSGAASRSEKALQPQRPFGFGRQQSTPSTQGRKGWLLEFSLKSQRKEMRLWVSKSAHVPRCTWILYFFAFKQL